LVIERASEFLKSKTGRRDKYEDTKPRGKGYEK
jgi:hypothetical protein